MNATSHTIAFLRTLTLDGLLTSEEVWALAKFFNENPRCAECWPGDLLVPMLQSAFDDARIAEEEMQSLADTISSIEEEWLGKVGARELAEETPPVAVEPKPALMPIIDQRIEVPTQREDTSYVVALRDHSCTCPEWARRQQHPPRHPGRCCRHMAYAFTRSGKVFEPWFQALLDDCFAKARGTQSEGDWMLLEVQPKKAILMGGGSGQWFTIFAPGDEGYESFAFNPAIGRWSYGESPQTARLIEQVIRENFIIAPS
jgi:hypothetical protein